MPGSPGESEARGVTGAAGPAAGPAAPATRLARIGLYFGRMLPLPGLLLFGTLSFLAVYVGLQALARPAAAPVLTWHVLPGALTVAGLAALLRVQDDLKDRETDLRLAAAGDPRFAGRPTTAGAVGLEDLEAFRAGLVAGLVALNLPFGPSPGLLAFAAVLGLCLLSSRWFFWPRIRESLLLALATHNPLALAISGYSAAVAIQGACLDGVPPGPAAALLLGLYFPVTGWEIARKVRLPEDETEYATYSKIFGWRGAAALAAALVGLSAALLCAAGREAALGPAFAAAVLAAAALPAGATARLLIAPTRRRAELRPFFEGYALLASATVAIAPALGRGAGLP